MTRTEMARRRHRAQPPHPRGGQPASVRGDALPARAGKSVEPDLAITRPTGGPDATTTGSCGRPGGRTRAHLPGRRGLQPGPAQPGVSQRRSTAAPSRILEISTCSSRGVGQVRVARAEVQRRDAERREPGHVGPARACRPASLPTAARNSRAGAAARPGQGARAPSPAISHVEAVEDLAQVRLASASVRSGANRKLTSISHRSGITLPATPPRMRTALSPSRYSQPSMATGGPGTPRAGAAPRPPRGSR